MAGVPFSRGGVFKGVSLCDSTMGVPSWSNTLTVQSAYKASPHQSLCIKLNSTLLYCFRLAPNNMLTSSNSRISDRTVFHSFWSSGW